MVKLSPMVGFSKEDYHNMDKILGRFYALKKLRSRYDMNQNRRV